MIDNSASMGDKQAYLEQAIPDLLRRLVTPDCVDASGNVVGVSQPDGTCAQGTAEFAPVHDLHIGIVSSSLGPRLGDKVGNGTGGECLPTATITVGGATLSQHNDDQGHLLTRSQPAGPDAGAPSETPLPDAAAGFLAWYPTSSANTGPAPANAITDAARLQSDFADLLAGVHQYGCGLESQLESWYRFLVQPDPYDSLALDANQHATWQGVDTTILAERHDFLRPDSAVAIVDLTDEDDSEIDVRSTGGQGYLFMATNFYPPRGTSACNTNPGDPACDTCGNGTTDPNCAQGPYNSPTDWGYDLNLRHVHMKAKYGIDPQYPVSRYVNGLTSPKVPDRNGEYPLNAAGKTSASYVGNNDCDNPLFAAQLPDGSSTDPKALCHLTPGARNKDLVFFLHIGGVPHQLLHVDPSNPASNHLSDADWVKILGQDPEHYDYTGIDPHMIESFQPRAGLPGPTSANDADPISGREWITNVGPHLDLIVDRQYACTFPLAAPRDCTQQDNRFACDCSSTGLSHDQLSPVCDPNTPTTQVAAKAYPTVRELMVAKGLGDHGIVASICPVDVVDNASQDDPLYGYRPAVMGLVGQLKGVLAGP
jgi:hypothetical protein